VIVVALIGLTKIKSESFIVDDIPHESMEYRDLKFFEKHFNGVMPLEIVIDTKKPNKFKGGTALAIMRKMDKTNKAIAKYTEFSSVLSIAEGFKFVNQAYFKGNPKSYKLPKSSDAKRIDKYLKPKKGEKNAKADELLSDFVDPTKQFARMSLRVQDIGSEQLPILVDSLRNDIQEIWGDKYDVKLTGTSVTFMTGTKSLTGSLVQTLILAFILIAIIMVILFRSGRMLFICLIPNTIPLIVTAGIMGYWGVPLKPSTVLVFSVAYGIAVDTSIHFLAKFQQEISRHAWDTRKTILVALKETGRSMIYNSLILFCGFITFTGSSFGGTVALGTLTSITLIVAMLTNTILLPSLLLTIEGRIRKSGIKRDQKRSTKLNSEIN
jgi:predicted RND superfamily exporter protein